MIWERNSWSVNFRITISFSTWRRTTDAGRLDCLGPPPYGSASARTFLWLIVASTSQALVVNPRRVASW